MSTASSRTERERPVKAREIVRARHGASIAQAAARILGTQARSVERSLAKLSDGKAGQSRVHKLRAELRRMEIMLGTLGCGFHAKRADRLTRLVRRLRREAGEVRDGDVAAEVVQRLCKSGDEPLRAAGKEVSQKLQ